ncbi:hypothetical protein R1sor_019552 [Riccia sorocarpa]|uniref:Uncharacterized protein n=1 Tax=Riccia sorocarpa TaxID=122646 RepID=A0ABD3IGH0_9MARC
MSFVPLLDVVNATRGHSPNVISRAVIRVWIVEACGRGDVGGRTVKGYVKLGDESVKGFRLDELPECLVFQAGEALMGCTPPAVMQLHSEEASSLLCGRLKDQWSISLELIRGISGFEMKVFSAERLEQVAVAEDLPLLPDHLLVDHGWSQEVCSGFNNMHLEAPLPSLSEVRTHLVLAETAIERTMRGEETLARVFNAVEAELKEARERVVHTKELLNRMQNSSRKAVADHLWNDHKIDIKNERARKGGITKWMALEAQSPAWSASEHGDHSEQVGNNVEGDTEPAPPPEEAPEQDDNMLDENIFEVHILSVTTILTGHLCRGS